MLSDLEKVYEAIPLPPVDKDRSREIYSIARKYVRENVKTGRVQETYASKAKTEEQAIRHNWAGFVGGYSVAQALGFTWFEGNESLWGNPRIGDIGDLQKDIHIDVRTRTQPGHQLTVKPKDTKPVILVLPERNWDLGAPHFHEIPQLWACGFQFPWYVRKVGETIGNPEHEIIACPASAVIPMRYLLPYTPKRAVERPGPAFKLVVE